jgi:hypothetical protein
MPDEDQKRIARHPGPVLVLVLNPSEPMVIGTKKLRTSVPILNEKILNFHRLKTNENWGILLQDTAKY